VHEDSKKFYFTLMDFRGATALFADKDFDGEPVQIYEPGADDPVSPPSDAPPSSTADQDLASTVDPEEEIVIDGCPLDPDPIGIGTAEPGNRGKVFVDGVSVAIIAERVEYLDENGKLITESLRDFTKKALRKRFTSLDSFLTQWNAADRKQAILDALAEEGLPLDPLAEEVGKDLDPFDLICHVAFDQPPLTRRERADSVRKRNVFTKYGPQARAVLDALLQKYQDTGAANLDDPRILQISPFDAMGTPFQLVKSFGTREDFERAVHELQSALYQKAA
jgi:type I restriction enzyme R subunit